MSGSDTIITMGGRKGRRVSKLLSHHVENEGPVRSLRYRRPRVTPLSPPDQALSPGESCWAQEKTPVQVNNDSGYLGDSTPPGSEPDWSVGLFDEITFYFVPAGSSGRGNLVARGGITISPNMTVGSLVRAGVPS